MNQNPKRTTDEANDSYLGESQPKISRKVIGTHSGVFHSDEVLAIAMLKQLPEYKNADIIRTRDNRELATCNIVVDVGTVFDAASNRFDHHQPSFKLTIKDFHPELEPAVKLSSAGLIYAHFGKRVITEIARKLNSNEDLEAVFKRLYKCFISEVDAIDNGVSILDGQPNYCIATGISDRVKFLNPSWIRKENDMQCFLKAVALVSDEIVANVRRLVDDWLPARTIVKDALKSRFSVHPSGMIIKMTTPGCPWMEHIYDLEKEEKDIAKTAGPLPFSGRPVFIFRPGAKTSSVTGISLSEDQPYVYRVLFPESWAGKEDYELDRAVGISGCIFAHSARFMVKHRTQYGALKMAELALKATGYL